MVESTAPGLSAAWRVRPLTGINTHSLLPSTLPLPHGTGFGLRYTGDR